MAQRRQEYEAEQARRRRITEARRTVDYTLIVTQRTNVSTTTSGGSLAGALIGDAVAGPLGAVIGAMPDRVNTTSTNYTTFAVYYKDGHRQIMEVQNGTAKYREFMDKLRLDGETAVTPGELLRQTQALLDQGAITQEVYNDIRDKLLRAK